MKYPYRPITVDPSTAVAQHVESENYVWCDHHGEIHEAKKDLYQEGADECQRENWRPVFVLGEPGEAF